MSGTSPNTSGTLGRTPAWGELNKYPKLTDVSTGLFSKFIPFRISSTPNRNRHEHVFSTYRTDHPARLKSRTAPGESRIYPAPALVFCTPLGNYRTFYCPNTTPIASLGFNQITDLLHLVLVLPGAKNSLLSVCS